MNECCGKYSGHVFVFGSNLAGRHGKGAAKHAVERHGAIYGVGAGRQGMSYAIPTKCGALDTLSLHIIRYHVWEFVRYAEENPETAFYLTRVGCGLSGYADWQIAPLFSGCPPNIVLPHEWKALLEALTYP